MVAQHERELISARTKAALKAAKKRGTKLGGFRGYVPSAKVRAKAIATREARADARAADLSETIAELQAAGATSLRAIAAGLNERGIPTARGDGEWSATQVMRVLERLDPFRVEIDGKAATPAEAQEAIIKSFGVGQKIIVTTPCGVRFDQ